MKLFANKYAEVSKIRTNFNEVGFAIRFAMFGADSRTKLFAELLEYVEYPKFCEKAFEVAEKGEMVKELALVHSCLEQFKREQGSYPESLEQLTPKYISAIPKDRFTEGGELKYRSNGRKFKLYSIGKDDKETDEAPNKNENKEYDIVISVP